MAAAFALLPSSAFAQETVSASTITAIPGATACSAPAVGNFHPYIYEGGMHSFDVTISDPSYVAVAGSVGASPVPFYQMTRRINPDGSLRVHVDIATTPLPRVNPIILTLISTKRQGSSVCITSVSISAPGRTAPAFEVISRETPSAPAKPASSTTTGTDTGIAAPVKDSDSSVTKAVTVPFQLHTPAVLSRVTQAIQKNSCPAPGKAPRFWFIFLVLYVLSLGAISLSRPPADEVRPVAWIISVLLIPLLLLGAFWYVSVACGTSLWVPVLAFILGILGLLAALHSNKPATLPKDLMLPEHTHKEGDTSR